MKTLTIKKKAVSPVIATILIIALVVAATAIVYLALMPMFSGSPNLVHMSTSFYDREGNRYVDRIDLDLMNLGTAKAVVEEVELYRNDELVEWTCTNAPVEIETSSRGIVQIEPLNVEHHRIKYGDDVNVIIKYAGFEETIDVTIPAQYSPIIVRYSEDFENYAIGQHLDSTKWTYYHIADHSPVGTRSIVDWVVDETNGRKFVKSTSNNCQFVILNDSTDPNKYVFGDVNITFSLNANGDDDIMGIIFRFQIDEENIPRYYLLAHTNDHTLTDTRNGPHFNGNMEMYKLTLFYVEGHASL